jgi:chaperone modulatory protein CbpM
VNIELAEALWIEDAGELSIAELAQQSGLEEGKLRELVDYGALAPIDPGATAWRFTASCVVIARTACRLLNDFDLEPHGLALALALIERIRELEAEVQRLHAATPR